MMNFGEKYLLQLLDSERRILESWQKLRNDAEFCDVTLISNEGIKIKAHKVILASLSTEFETMLRNEDHQQHALLYLRGVEYSQIVYLLDFIYNGQVSISQDHLDQFLTLANDLKIKGLDEEVNESFEHFKNFSDLSIEDKRDNKYNKKKRNESLINYENIKMIESVSEPVLDNVSKLVQTVSSIEETSGPNKNLKRIKESKINYENINMIESDAEPAPKSVLTSSLTEKLVIDTKHELVLHNTKIEVESNYLLNSCDRCSYQTNVKSHLNVHIKSIHEGIRYPCTKCAYKATTQSGLNHHVKSIHDGVKYKCGECDLQTSNKHYLTQHGNRVHDQTPYSCSECGESIIGKYRFDQHMKSKHFVSSIIV